MKLIALAAFLALTQQPCAATSVDATSNTSTLDQQRSLSSGWALCGPEGGKQEWMWAARQICDANGLRQCLPGWRTTDKDPFCGFEVPECTEGNPCNVGIIEGTNCVEKDPDNGLYECVCDFGLNGSEDRGFGPTNCSPSCVTAPGLCDTANGGFCTSDNNDSFSCACPGGTLDVNGDGSLCRNTDSIVSPGGTTPDTACPEEGCPSGQFCGQKPTGGDVCVIIDLNPTDENEGEVDPEAFCKNVENTEECCTEELKAKCDSNNYCGIHPDRGPVCFCNPNWWQVHPGGFCRKETSNCANCAPSNSQCTNNVCSCSSGYIGNGNTCIDQNECDLKLDNCAANQGCVNTDGGFDCIDLVIAPAPTPVTAVPTVSLSPSRTVSRPRPAAFVTAPLIVTLTLDDQAATDNSFVIFNTFNNMEILFGGESLDAGPTDYTSEDSFKSNGCYTLVVYDTGADAAEGLTNSAAIPQVQVSIGGRLLLDEELAPQGTQEAFPYKSYRFGTGCSCSGGKTAYDIKLFDPNVGTDTLVVFDHFLDFDSFDEFFLFVFGDSLPLINDPTFLEDLDIPPALLDAVDVLYEGIPPGILIDTRVCASSCRVIEVYGAPLHFKVTKAKGNSIDVDSDDYKLAEGAVSSAGCDCGGPITGILIGDNCCPTGSKLLHQSFFSPVTDTTPENEIPIVQRELNAVTSQFMLDIPEYSAGTDITSNIPEFFPDQMSQCVEAVACLRYQIPTVTGLSYLINLDNDVRTGVSTTTDANTDIEEEFGTMCAGGSLMISLSTGGVAGTSIIVTDINNGEVALYLSPDDTANAPDDSVDLTLSPSSEGCYSVTILNPNGNAAGSITYDIEFEGTSILQTNSPFPFPAAGSASSEMYDTVRFGDGCQCDPLAGDDHAHIPVDMQLLVLDNTDDQAYFDIYAYDFFEDFLLHASDLLVADAFVYDAGVCIHSNEDNELDISQLFEGNIASFLSLDIDNVETLRTDTPPPFVQLLVCDPVTHDEVELTTTDEGVAFIIEQLSGTSFASGGSVSLFAPRACIPRDSCTMFFIEDAAAVQTSNAQFTFENKDGSIQVGDGLFPVDPLFSESCPSIVVTVEGASSSTSVYAYSAKQAVSLTGLLLDGVVTDLSLHTFSTNYVPFDCYTVAVVDTAGNLDAATVTVGILEGSVTTPSTPKAAFDEASGKHYQYYEVGNCGCGAAENKEMKILWYTPPDADEVVKTIGFQHKDNPDRLLDNDVMGSFLYNYVSCVTPEQQLAQCLGVWVFNKNVGSIGQKYVDPLNYYHAYFGDDLMYSGVYNKDDGGYFTQGCCVGSTEDVAVLSYYLGRDPTFNLGVRRTAKRIEDGGQSEALSSSNGIDGAAYIQHFCYDASGDTACAQIKFAKSTGTVFNFGEEGFLNVVYQSEAGKDPFTPVVGDATGVDIPIFSVDVGSVTCIANL